MKIEEKKIKNEKKNKSKTKSKEININSQEYIDEMLKNKKKRIKIAIISVAIIVVILILCTVFAIVTMLNNKIIHGVTINNVNVSGMTVKEAKEKIEEELSNQLSQKLEFNYQDFTEEFTTEDIEATYKIDEAVENAFREGREDNIIINNFNIVKSFFVKENLQIEVSYNIEKLDSIITDIENNIPGKVTDNTYCIEEDELIITRGTKGIKVNKDELKNIIIDRIVNITPERKENVIDIPADTAQPDEIDIEKIYEEVHTEPQDAYIEKDPFKLVVDVDGIDFAISIEEAKELLKEYKEEYIIPLKIQKAAKTVNDLGEEAFPHALANFTTKYDASNKNRTTNLELAAGKLNGTVVLPGETFSYNKVVGKRTIENGYKEAAVYSNGAVENGIGGGICQISTTLYNAVVLANLDIVERTNHSFLTSYAEASRDATVVYGSIDFQFKNTRTYPIKVVASVSGGIASVSIYGIKEDVEYTVKITSSKTGTIPYTTETIEDATLAEGEEVVKQSGSNGCKSVAYKELYLDGKFVSKTLLSTDTYSAMKRIIRVGTKKSTTQTSTTSETPVTSTPTPEPTITPTPEPTSTPEETEVPETQG